MASAVALGPAPPPGLTRLSVSSPSIPSSASSSESPLNTPSFSMVFRYSSGGASDDESPVVPKIEELEDDGVPETKIEPIAEDAELSPAKPRTPTTARRGRGRPRKHPPTTTTVAKGRSKTGCFTCRKRKKKCDETKPKCTCIRSSCCRRVLTWLTSSRLALQEEQRDM
jgi:hypothetical protein